MSSVIITGGCGFLGAALAQAIAENGVVLPDGRHLTTPDIHLWDRAGAHIPDVARALFGRVDIADTDAVAAAMPDDVALIYHLAAVVSGQAEQDYDLAMRVNLGGTNAVLSAARAIGPNICVIGTSSLAVYGHGFAEPLTEDTPIQPRNTYGVTKAMAEMVMADHRRRGWLDARTLRLPTITVRPGKPNAAASSFASSIIREPLAGQRAICPVETDLALWVASPAAAVQALRHAPSVSLDLWPAFGAVNVPGLQVAVAEMLAALGDKAALVDHVADPAVRAIVGGWPTLFDTSLAEQLGFVGDAGLEAIIAQAEGLT